MFRSVSLSNPAPNPSVVPIEYRPILTSPVAIAVAKKLDFRPMISLSTIGTTRQVLIVGPWAIKLARGARGRRCNNYEAHLYRTVSALPTLLLTIKRHQHILRHAKHHWQIPLRAEKSPRCDRTAMIRGFSRPILNS